MNTKHTPGPWRAGDAATAIYGPKKPGGTLPQRIATVTDDVFPTSMQRANVLLIAAAPELLDALQFLLTAFEGTPSHMDYRIEKARAAIAKATA